LSVESSSVSVPSCLWCTMTFFFVSRWCHTEHFF
jgi:hypothetical protein